MPYSERILFIWLKCSDLKVSASRQFGKVFNFCLFFFFSHQDVFFLPDTIMAILKHVCKLVIKSMCLIKSWHPLKLFI